MHGGLMCIYPYRAFTKGRGGQGEKRTVHPGTASPENVQVFPMKKVILQAYLRKNISVHTFFTRYAYFTACIEILQDV